MIFFKGFLRRWRGVGSPFPSSQCLARRVCKLIDFHTARTIIEAGPGTGAITREILSMLHPEGTLTVFETDATFCNELRSIPDPRLKVHNVSALEMHAVLPNKRTAQYLVSGLPIAMMSQSDFLKFHRAVRGVIEPDGKFIQLQLTPVSYVRLKQVFSEVRVRFTLWSAPPAFVYLCQCLTPGGYETQLRAAGENTEGLELM